MPKYIYSFYCGQNGVATQNCELTHFYSSQNLDLSDHKLFINNKVSDSLR